MERSPHSGKNIFTALMAEHGLLHTDEHELYTELYEKLSWTPTEHVYLRCSPELALKRVHMRSREHEHAVDLAYLTALHCKHEEQYANAALVIDASQPLDAVVAELRRHVLGQDDAAPPAVAPASTAPPA